MTLSEAKVCAHEVFDRIWKSRRMTRRQAYAWMRDLLGLRPEAAHIAYLNLYQCLELIRWSRQLLLTVPKPRRRLS